MDVRFFFGAITLAPAIAALLLVALGLWRRPIRRFALALGIVGAAIPLLGLLYLASEMFSGVPLRLALVGQSTRAWYSPAYRADTLSLYAALGVAVVVAPLLLWMAWRGGVAPAPEPEAPPDEEAAPEAADGDATTDTADRPGRAGRAGRGEWMQQFVGVERWVGLALALGLESAALTLCFADNLFFLGIGWLALVVLAWGLGEIGSEAGDFDRLSLALMLVGPVLWVAALLFIAVPAGTFRLNDLMGIGGVSLGLALLAGIILALAAGAYPFLGWVRRRAIVTPAAGFAAVMLAVLPAVLYIGARTYATMQDAAGLWPQLGAAAPPITIGIVLILLGALTVAVCGLLALGRRDGRALVALLAVAQVGWGVVALGIGRPLGLLALVMLLATGMLGLGAMIATLFAGGMLTGDLEPPGAGPRPFGAPWRPLGLIAWCLGAATLVGAPPLAGFAVRQMVSAASLGAAQLSIPLVALAWVGDALLALALLRATAPAFASESHDLEKEGSAAEPEGSPPAEGTVIPARPTPASVSAEGEGGAAGAEGAEAEEAEEAAEAPTSLATRPWRGRLAGLDLGELPGLALALVALVVGVVPGLLLLLGARAAAGDVLPPNALDTALQVTPLGYGVDGGQWLPGLAWIVLLVGGALAALVGRLAPRVARPVYLAGQAAAEAALASLSGEVAEEEEGEEGEGDEATAAAAAAPMAAVPAAAAPANGGGVAEATEAGGEEAEEAGPEVGHLAEPGDAWHDLGPAFRSAWTTPGSEWLLRGLEGDEGEGDEGEGDEGDEHDATDQDAADEAEEPGASAAAPPGRDEPPALRGTDEAARRRAAEGTGTGDQG